MNRAHLYLLCAALTLSALAVFGYKVLVLDFPLSPEHKLSIWTIEANVQFEAQDKSTKVSLYIPKNTARFAVMDENFISPAMSLSTGVEEYNRRALWSSRKVEGTQNLYYRAVVRALEQRDQPLAYKQPVLEDPNFKGAELAAAKALLADAKRSSTDTLSLVSAVIKQLLATDPTDNARLLLGKKGNDLLRADLAVRILGLDSIVARVVHGINLQSYSRSTKLIHWIEVYHQKSWHSFDARNGEQWISADYLPWWKGTEPLVSVEGASRVKSSVSVEPREEEAIETALAKLGATSPLLLEYSLFSLPIEAQMVYRVLLMIPLGALLVVLLRNVIGIRTFGTFMPILVALAFRETGLFWGLAFFVTLVSAGLLVRFYLERLKLLLVPRLAAILTVVVLLMALTSIVSHQLGIGHGLSVALFPMVIMTMSVERMSIVWDELGAQAALRQALATLFAASLIYLLIRIKFLEYIFFVFPETILIILAFNLLLGRYTGFRLLELRRFREIARGQDA